MKKQLNKQELFARTPVPKALMTLAVPTIISQIINLIYNMVDAFFIGRTGNSYMMAATTITLTMVMMNVALSNLFGIGGGSLVARLMGAGEPEKARRVSAFAALGAVLIAVVYSLALGLFLDPVLRFLGASDATIGYARSYALIVIVAGSLPGILSMTLAHLLRNTGFSSQASLGLSLGGILNCALDPLFMFVLLPRGQEVVGAALATILSQCASCVWVVCFLTGKHTLLRLSPAQMRVDPKLILPCVALGSSTFIMQASESVISVCFNASLLRYGGDLAVGAMTILTSVMQFAMLPLQGLGQGAQPISSYNFGARNAPRVRQTFRLLLTSCLTYSITLWVVIMLFPGVFVRLFNNDPALVEFTVRALRIYCGALFLFGIQIACQMTFVSTGNAPCSIIVAVLRKFVLLIPLIYILPHFLQDQTTAVYLAEPVADGIAVTCTAILFAVQFRKALRGIENAAHNPK